MLHEWHIVLLFGVGVGYVIRYAHERIARARKRASVYRGRWPLLVIVGATLSFQGCALFSTPRVRVIRTETVTITRVCKGKGCEAKSAKEDLEKDHQEAKHFLDLQFSKHKLK